MKTKLILFVYLIISGCGVNYDEEEKLAEHNNKVKLEKQPCELKEINDANDLGLFTGDITLSSVQQEDEDEQGTIWKTATQDNYRFITSSIDTSPQLIVYKNKELINKFTDLKYECSHHIPLNFSECSLNHLKETLDITLKLRPKKKLSDLDYIAHLHESILQFKYYREINTIVVTFHLNSKTTIIGYINT